MQISGGAVSNCGLASQFSAHEHEHSPKSALQLVPTEIIL